MINLLKTRHGKLYKYCFLNSELSDSLPFVKTKLLMLFRKIINVYCDNQAEHIKCLKNSEFLNITTACTNR